MKLKVKGLLWNETKLCGKFLAPTWLLQIKQVGSRTHESSDSLGPFWDQQYDRNLSLCWNEPTFQLRPWYQSKLGWIAFPYSSSCGSSIVLVIFRVFNDHSFWRYFSENHSWQNFETYVAIWLIIGNSECNWCSIGKACSLLFIIIMFPRKEDLKRFKLVCENCNLSKWLHRLLEKPLADFQEEFNNQNWLQ